MIIRTPPNQKRKLNSSPISDRRLVVYDEQLPVSISEPSDELVCTYQCRQMVKSEFIVALDSAEKQVVEYKSKVESLINALEKSGRKKEEERNGFEENLKYSKQELEATKGRENSLQERLLKEITDSQERYQTQLKKCYELEAQVKKEAESRKKAELAAMEAKERATILEGEIKKLSESTKREKTSLQMELKLLKDNSNLSIARAAADLEKTKLRADNFEQETELLKDQLKVLQEQLNECLCQKNEIEHKLTTFEARPHETGHSKDQTLVKHLQDELRKYEAEIHEARKLKSSHLENELLKEKLREEKSSREKAEWKLSELQNVELHAENVEHELMQWKSLLTVIPDVSTYEDIPQKFARLQQEVIESMVKVGEINAHMKELEVALTMSEQSKEEAEKNHLLALEKADSSRSEIKQLEQMLSSATKERDQLRKDNPSLDKHNAAISDSGLENESVIKNLEKALAEKENAMRELEASVHEQREIINRQYSELKMMNERVGVEAKLVKSLERDGDRLRSEIALLEAKLGHGDYSASNTKVLRMVNTLAVDNEAKQTIEALRAELQKTQSKLQALEELKGQSDADIPEKLAQLKGQIAVLEKREERYRTVFKERISVFRRACCLLFGYNILMDDQQRPNGISVTKFTLQSIYAQTDDEKLEFDYESENMNILVNDYSSQPDISHQADIFIKKMNSIPAFTANLTIEAFNRRTLS